MEKYIIIGLYTYIFNILHKTTSTVIGLDLDGKFSGVLKKYIFFNIYTATFYHSTFFFSITILCGFQ